MIRPVWPVPGGAIAFGTMPPERAQTMVGTTTWDDPSRVAILHDDLTWEVPDYPILMLLR
jgi:hypothetical protein